jgi:hypothetical protein
MYNIIYLLVCIGILLIACRYLASQLTTWSKREHNRAQAEAAAMGERIRKARQLEQIRYGLGKTNAKKTT